MSEATIATIGFLVLALIEGFNGIGLAFRTKRTLESAGLDYTNGPGVLIQEFGIYSLGMAVAYLIAASDPVRFGGVGLMGMMINLGAGTMHLFRSVGVYVGDARPMLGRLFERKAGIVHTFAVLVLVLNQTGLGSVICS
ncbi:MAG: hypothetical protein QM706_04665 [Nitrospira sp.]